jgi:hypothetical protein
MALHFVEQPAAEIVLLEQVAKAAHRRLIGHRLTAEVDASKTPHRLRIVKRLFDRWIRQIEAMFMPWVTCGNVE